MAEEATYLEPRTQVTAAEAPEATYLEPRTAPAPDAAPFYDQIDPVQQQPGPVSDAGNQMPVMPSKVDLGPDSDDDLDL